MGEKAGTKEWAKPGESGATELQEKKNRRSISRVMEETGCPHADKPMGKGLFRKTEGKWALGGGLKKTNRHLLISSGRAKKNAKSMGTNEGEPHETAINRGETKV